MWVFLNQTAARAGDALKLRYADFNHLEGNILNLKEQKTGKTRSIMLAARALELVAQRRADNPGHEYLFEVDSNRAKDKPICRVTVSAKFNYPPSEVMRLVARSRHP
ncbi:tyrosine-type recombinase/integrase [Raoultella sp. C349492]|uniref:tyrosine-type recombinase/integrase n=1 Tax=Raoultella sp. C349492 TaxID=2970253 RepID=UPI0035C6F5D7